MFPKFTQYHACWEQHSEALGIYLDPAAALRILVEHCRFCQQDVVMISKDMVHRRPLGKNVLIHLIDSIKGFS